MPYVNLQMIIQILEYNEDLIYYYKHGYGMEINLKVACPLLRDLIVRLKWGSQSILLNRLFV